jgi:hypothetical protein
MSNHLVINNNPPFVQWKEKMSILMVTFIMVGVWLMSIPIVGYFNGKIQWIDFTEILASLGIFIFGTFLTYLGLSSAILTIYFHNHCLTIEKKIGFLRFYKKFHFNENSQLIMENQEDEDGITWYHLVLVKENQKKYILKYLEETQYQTLKNFL